MNEPGEERATKDPWGRWYWIVIVGLLVAAAVSLVVVQKLRRTASEKLLDEMARIGAQDFGGGLIWARYQPFPKAGTNRMKPDLPEDFGANATNALPDLLKLLELDVTGSSTRRSLLDKLPLAIRRWLPIDTNPREVGRAIAVFYALGPDAAFALPELGTRLTNYATSTCAAHALAGIGSVSQPAFVNALASSNSWVRLCGAWGLGQFGSASRPYAGDIARAYLLDPNDGGAGLMFWSLGETGGPPDEVVPILSRGLTSTNAWIASPAASALLKVIEVSRLPPGDAEGWSPGEKEWFDLQRPALIGQLENIASGPGSSGQGPGTPGAVAKALKELKGPDATPR
jgi:hypothetical protein